jgi:hypothetical protein
MFNGVPAPKLVELTGFTGGAVSKDHARRVCQGRALAEGNRWSVNAIGARPNFPTGNSAV